MLGQYASEKHYGDARGSRGRGEHSAGTQLLAGESAHDGEELDRAHWVPVGLAIRDSDVEDPPQKGQSPVDVGRRDLL